VVLNAFPLLGRQTVSLSVLRFSNNPSVVAGVQPNAGLAVSITIVDGRWCSRVLSPICLDITFGTVTFSAARPSPLSRHKVPPAFHLGSDKGLRILEHPTSDFVSIPGSGSLTSHMPSSAVPESIL